MKRGAGKRKGNAFENWCGRKLSLWLTDGEDKTQLIPSRLSGGWQDKAWRHAGDLAPNGKVGEHFREWFVVECKHRNADVLWALYNGRGENIRGWWSKLCAEAKSVERWPLLLVRQNNRSVLAVLPSNLASHVCGQNDVCIKWRCGEEEAGIVLFDVLLRADPARVFTFCKRSGGWC